jgi:hypothetical protein
MSVVARRSYCRIPELTLISQQRSLKRFKLSDLVQLKFRSQQIHYDLIVPPAAHHDDAAKPSG